jgi:hypothetical protein
VTGGYRLCLWQCLAGEGLHCSTDSSWRTE